VESEANSFSQRLQLVATFLTCENLVLKFLATFLHHHEQVCFLRSVLFLLPLMLGGCFTSNKRIPTGNETRAKLLRHSLRTGFYPTPDGDFFDSTKTTSRSDIIGELQRFNSGAVAERLYHNRHPLLAYFGSFAKFLAVWCASSDRLPKCFAKSRVVAVDATLVLCNLGDHLLDLSVCDQQHCARHYHRIALCLYSLYGHDGTLDFWRLADFPIAYCPTMDLDLFSNSILQKELCE
jgi:hypothetical protein